MTVTLAGEDKKILDLQATRDLFGRLLYLAVNKGLNLDLVFRYPLTPIPLYLGHVNGFINKTDKAKLEERVQSRVPEEIDACALEAFFYSNSGEYACDLWRNSQINFH